MRELPIGRLGRIAGLGAFRIKSLVAVPLDVRKADKVQQWRNW